MFWIGLGIGLLVGSPIGFFTFALCAIAKQADIRDREYREGLIRGSHLKVPIPYPDEEIEDDEFDDSLARFLEDVSE